MKSSVSLLGALATTMAAGHGLVTDFWINGQHQQGFLLDYYYAKKNGGTYPDIAAWYAENLDIGFVAPTEYNTAAINCHKNASPGKLTKTVPAGGEMKFYWEAANKQPWPHSQGPVLSYIAACNGDCSKADPTRLQWVKIDAKGIDYTTQRWASEDLIANNNTWTSKIPASIAPGNYVFRHEIIALHAAGSLNGAQNYPQCFNIQITGSGNAKPSGTLGTALYKADHPGILFNPYRTITDYPMPGPTLFKG
ncbi:Endoglucanase-7 [Apiospora arundinis]|uniref:lytic cellulose monooxygenase (C4-dehydrogenating) n=1 Tax=Apiospora arundinis TaxID=335852 RepID=A0ABR2I8Y1_9PEZI